MKSLVFVTTAIILLSANIFAAPCHSFENSIDKTKGDLKKDISMNQVIEKVTRTLSTIDSNGELPSEIKKYLDYHYDNLTQKDINVTITKTYQFIVDQISLYSTAPPPIPVIPSPGDKRSYEFEYDDGQTVWRVTQHWVFVKNPETGQGSWSLDSQSQKKIRDSRHFEYEK